MKPAFATTAVIMFVLVYYGLQRAPGPTPGPGAVAPTVALGDVWARDVAAAPPEPQAPTPDVAAGGFTLELPSVAATDPVPTYEATASDIVPLAGPTDSPRETVTVRRGDSLWQIANRAYRDGGRARAIYEANRDQVADPERIYPGQVLVLP